MTTAYPDPTAYCVAQTTTDSEAAAEVLARQIVQARLAACVQVQPIKSFYVWQEQAHEDREYLLSIKTRSALYPALEAFIRQHHSYETPEIVQLPITAGSVSYLSWVDGNTRSPAA